MSEPRTKDNTTLHSTPVKNNHDLIDISFDNYHLGDCTGSKIADAIGIILVAPIVGTINMLWNICDH